MSVVRVYEFSKQSGIPSKELLEILKKGGFTVASHMSTLTDEAVAFLEKELKKSSSKESEKPKVQKATTSTPEKSKIVQPTPAPSKASPSQPAPQVAPKEPVKAKVAETVAPKVEKPVAQPTPQQAAAQPVATEPKKAEPVVQKPVQKPEPVAQRPAYKHESTYRPQYRHQQTTSRAPERVEEKFVAPTSIDIAPMTVEEIALKLGRPVTDVILTLLKKGVMAPKNKLLADKVLADLVRHYGIEAVFPEKKFENVDKKLTLSTSKLEDRMPVVVVMGHVDHGKTTLLDFIRKTRVAAKEKGGITQHLGAYEVDTAQGGIVFLDTPGHEAFSQIRARGAKVADLAVLVVAADDSVKPQTVEAVKHAKAMELPIIVAVNKIDKVEPQRVDVVKRDLAQYELLPEEWGGSTVFMPISAKLGTGVVQLLEMIALQAQMMELKADTTIAARGIILESRLEKGRGPVATLICQEGVVKTGDFFVCGSTQGKVTSMVDSLGRRVALAGPSVPVQISGFEEVAGVGDIFEVVSESAYRTARASKSERRVLPPRSAAQAEDTINIIVKADGNASREALLGALRGVSVKGGKELYVVHSAVGDITESDALLASDTGSMIVGLHVKAETNAASMAQRAGVTIKLFDIIYKLIEDLQETLEATKAVVMVKQKIGEAIVRKVFDIKGLGVIAGSYVKDGRVTRDAFVVIWRGREKVGQGRIRSLQRDKKSVKEIQAGFECAFMVDGFTEWAEEDRVECFIEIPQDQAKK